MNNLQISAFKSFLQGNCVNPKELAEYMNTINVGDFHFTNGVHCPFLINGMTADGVYVSDDCYVTNIERDGKTTLSRANRFCNNRGVTLPDCVARGNMERYRDKLNESLRLLGFVPLREGDYWAKDDAPGKGESGEIHFDSSDIGGWNYYGGSWTSYKKFVRGCVKVKKSQAPTVENVQDDEKEVPDTVFGRLAESLNVSQPRFFHFRNGDLCLPKAGDFLLKDGRCSSCTVYDQEQGIFINANLALSLNMPKLSLSASQALTYCKAFNCRLPDFFELRQIAKVLPKINNSLKSVGMADYTLSPGILTDCWTKELLNKAVEEGDEKNNLRFLPLIYKEEVPDAYIILQDIRDRFFPDGL